MLRIAFDLDGVLADMDGELARHAETLFGKSAVRTQAAPVPEPEPGTDPAAERSSASDTTASQADDASDADTPPPPVSLNLTPRQIHRLWDHVQAIENFWGTLAEIEPGVIARLGALASERRWEIIFLTKRPRSAGATAQVQTQRWLESKGFSLPSVFVVQGSRGRIASALALDAVVDDRPENCMDIVADSSARAILVWRHDQQQLPEAVRRLGMGVVATVAECLDVLIEMDSPPAREQRGLLARVKRALGLKESV